MINENEIIQHPNQTFIEFAEDINDAEVFKCKKCCWISYNDNIEFLCICPFSEFESKCVKYNKGCEHYHNHNEPHISSILDDDMQGVLF